MAGVGLHSPLQSNFLEVKLAVSVPGKHAQAQHAAKLFSVVRTLQSWGPGKQLLFSQSDWVLAGVEGRILKWQEFSWSTSIGPLSNLDRWIQLIDLVDQHHKPVVFAKFGIGVLMAECSRAEELALEALCSHPSRRGAWGGGKGTMPPRVLTGRLGGLSGGVA